jgi:hypothetical protein
VPIKTINFGTGPTWVHEDPAYRYPYQICKTSTIAEPEAKPAAKPAAMTVGDGVRAAELLGYKPKHAS